MTRFAVDVLRRMAGNTVFARGQAYHQDGRVEILRQKPGRVVARVSGTEDYRTVLTGDGTEIDGECSCPAFEDRGFCKHLVAVALTANETGDDDAGSLERIRGHLLAKGVDTLVAMILDLAERDDSLCRRLEMDAAAACDEDDILDARFRKAIDDATDTNGFVHYREAAGWADEVEAVLDRIEALASQGRAALALGLINHALSRIEDAINQIDDSDGHCGGLLEWAHDIHLAACRAARPDPVALAGELYAREVEGDWDTFHNSAALYADVLGEAGLAELRRLAAAAWDKIPPLPGGRRAKDDFSTERGRLAGILDFFAERDGDVEVRIALRAHDLSSPWRYLELARFCLSLGRESEFRAAADVVAAAWRSFPEVQAIALIGSVAKPLPKEVPRFQPFRRHGIELWHECGDLDLAVWLGSQDLLGDMRRARDLALRRACDSGTGIRVANHQVDTFLFEPGSDRYLGRLCSFAQCPKGKRDCLTPGCGTVPFNKAVEGFRPDDTLLASVVALYDRASGYTWRAADLPVADDTSAPA